VNLFTGQNGAIYAGVGAMRLAARHRVAPVHALSSCTAAWHLTVFVVDSKAPQGGAQAP